MSSRRLVIPRGLVALEGRALPAAGGGTRAATAPPPRTVPTLRAEELDKIRQEAYERGRREERESASRLFAQGAVTLDREARQLAESREQDREIVRDFAVRLSCVIAEELVGTLIDADAHDLRAMVTRVLDQVLPEFSGEKVVLQVHPDDLSLISNDYLKEIGAAAVRVVPNPSLERAAMRVVGNGAEFYAGVGDRLEAMKSTLLRDLGDADDDRT